MSIPRGHFTVGEVEALIPSLERIFVQVLQLRAGLRALGQKLDRAGVSRSSASVGSSPEARSSASTAARSSASDDLPGDGADGGTASPAARARS